MAFCIDVIKTETRMVPGTRRSDFPEGKKGYVLINEIPMEDYIRYVLPSEMPLSFSYEALKAQAVCARTFTYGQMKNDTYARYGANLDDSIAYQPIMQQLPMK